MSGFSQIIFSDRLSILRKNRQLYQKEIASLLGITERQYRDYEGGRVNPPTSNLYALADYFEVSIDYLVGRSNDPKRR